MDLLLVKWSMGPLGDSSFLDGFLFWGVGVRVFESDKGFLDARGLFLYGRYG